MGTHLKTVMVHMLDTSPVPTLWPIGPCINSKDLVPYTDATEMMPDVIPKMGTLRRPKSTGVWTARQMVYNGFNVF